ncbi:hypothetical protein LWI28_022107 [Acer negundo]|uniref:RNase H type-1 domain-containing protein n=1 Tax=Acer negundo TaxID=4023 RepID=A0AAD5NPT9_ACENE|nr:hypothetical protein LWI28_008115 [Acer negundo]KAI9174738.1 hypothetical protein LWI28_022107 [Acer negundo]
MAASSQRIQAGYTVEIAEAMAPLQGIRLAIETDVGLVVSDIQHYLCCGSVISVHHVSRQANCVAHSLAKMALAAADDRFWIGNSSFRQDCSG